MNDTIQDNPISILIVEDDEIYCKTYDLRLMNSAVSYDLRFAKTGERALSILKIREFDCILLDYQLPGINGIEVLAEIHKLHPQTPVIVLTGQSSPQVEEEFRIKGVYNFLNKNEKNLLNLEMAIHEAIKERQEFLATTFDNIPHNIKKILVVDSEKTVHLTMDRIFKKSGIHLEHALSANEALKHIQDEFGVILSDINLPDMDGIQFLRRIQQIDPYTEVIIISGYGSIEKAMQAKRYGAANYFIKPVIDADGLIKESLKCMSKRHDIQQNEELYMAILHGKIDAVKVGKKFQELPITRLTPQILYEELSENSNDGLAFLTVDGKISFCNTRFSRTTGYPFQSCIGMRFNNLIHPQDSVLFINALERLLYEGKYLLPEIRLKSQSGLVIYIMINMSCIRNSNGKIEDILLFLRDISDLRRIEKHIETLAHLVDNAKFEAILICDKNGFVIDCNIAAQEIFSRSKGNLLGTTVHEIIDGLDNVYLQEKDKSINFTPLFEVTALLPSGKSIPIEISFSRLTETEGIEARTMFFIRDITDRKHSEETLKNLNKELKRSNEELEQFSYAVSHDLKAPLRKLSMYGDFLIEEYSDKLDDKAQTYILKMQNGANQIRNLIDNILEISRVGIRESEHEIVNMNILIIEVLDLIQFKKIGTNSNGFQTFVDNDGNKIIVSDLPQIIGNQVRLKQVFQNLITNGLKFHKEEMSSIIKINAQIKANHILFSVADNGIGIEAHHLDKIFIIFKRLHPKDKYDGTGIGLALCKKIVQRHGGDIWCTSEVGKGSTFYFTLKK